MQKAWEKIILSVSLLLLAAGAIALAIFFPTKQDISGGNSANPTGAKITKIDSKESEQLSQGWFNGPKWDANKHLLFVSDSYLYDKKDAKIIAVDPATMIDGIPLPWLRENNIDIKSSTVALDDPDNDGFSNKMEYEHKTDPRDAASHPPFMTVLRLRSFDLIPFRLRFQSVNDLDGQKVFQINLLDVRTNKSRLVKVGDKLEGYTITNFEPKRVTRTNPNTGVTEDIDESTLTLEKPEIGFKIDLILNKTIDSPESTAHFIMLLPGKTDSDIIVQRGKEFALPQEPGTKYLLLRASNEGAVIRNTATQAEITVAKVSDTDYAGVPQAPKSTEPKRN